MLDGKRKAKRFPVELNGEYKEKGSTIEYLLCAVRDFSRHGCHLIAQSFSQSMGSAIELKVQVPGQENRVDVLGNVIWAKNIEGNWHAGVKFKEIDASSKWDILDHAYERWWRSSKR